MVEKIFISLFVSILVLAFAWWNLFCIVLNKHQYKSFYSILLSCFFTLVTLFFIQAFDLYLIANYKLSFPILLLLSGASFGFKNYANYSTWYKKLLHGTIVMSATSILLFYGLTTLFKIALR